MITLYSALGVTCIGNSSVFAQSVTLSEEVAVGNHFQCEIALIIDGYMKVVREDKPEAVPLKARAKHLILERVEAPDAKGGIGKVLRYYREAGSETEIASEKGRRELSKDRRLIVARRSGEGTQHYSPEGPLSREELELVAEHFDTLCLPALLPGRAVSPGETWSIGPEAAQHVCLFQGLIKNELVGKFVEVKDSQALFTIQGSAEGLDHGAHARLTVTATGKFDLISRRIVEIVWQQKDSRSQGPANPATEVTAVVTVKRSGLSDAPKELSEAAARVNPTHQEPVPDLLLALRYDDPAGRYQFVYHRDWHVVGRTRGHLVLRLIENGEFTAQATITDWQKVAPGHHTTPAEFKAVLARLPGWELEGAYEEQEIPTDPGRWLYRVAGKGKQDGLPVMQVFYLLAGPEGNQVAVTVVAQPEKASKLAPKDLMLVNAIEFPRRP
jgi:hypothetical protein